MTPEPAKAAPMVEPRMTITDPAAAAAVRVAVFTNSYSPRLVGPAIAIDNLTATTSEATSRWLVFAPEYRSMFSNRPRDERAVRLPSYRQWGVQRWALPLARLSLRTIRRTLDRFQPDVIHVHQPFALGVCGVDEARRRGLPVVYTFHTNYDHYAHYATRFASHLTGYYIRRRLPRFINTVDHVVVPTNAIARELRARGVVTPISTIPTGVSSARFYDASRERAQVRALLGVRDEQKLLLHVGRLVKEKRIDFLLRVMERLSRTDADYVLAIVGEGTQAAALRRLADELRLNGRIRWIGAVQQSELPRYYAAADLFVFASISDTQAIVLYEALAAGLPIVAVASQAAHAAVRRTEDGLMTDDDPVDFSNGVQRAWGSIGQFEPILDDGAKLETTVARYLQLLRGVVNDQARTNPVVGGATRTA